MAFQAGTQIRPELANADYSGFVNAANIRAQAMMNLGEQIGGAIKDYQIKKEEGEQRKIRYETILPYMKDKFNEEDAKNLSNLFAKQPKDFNAVYNLMVLEEDTKALNQALAVNTDTEGKVDYSNVVGSYLELGGRDPNMVAGLAEQASGPGEIIVDPKTGVISQGGRYKGMARQPETQDRSTATIKDTEDRLKRYQEARELFEAGDIKGADAILFALGEEDAFGIPTTAQDLFGSENNIPTITSQEQYDALESGQEYIDSQGNRAVKR